MSLFSSTAKFSVTFKDALQPGGLFKREDINNLETILHGMPEKSDEKRIANEIMGYVRSDYELDDKDIVDVKAGFEKLRKIEQQQNHKNFEPIFRTLSALLKNKKYSAPSSNVNSEQAYWKIGIQENRFEGSMTYNLGKTALATWRRNEPLVFPAYHTLTIESVRLANSQTKLKIERSANHLIVYPPSTFPSDATPLEINYSAPIFNSPDQCSDSTYCPFGLIANNDYSHYSIILMDGYEATLFPTAKKVGHLTIEVDDSNPDVEYFIIGKQDLENPHKYHSKPEGGLGGTALYAFKKTAMLSRTANVGNQVFQLIAHKDEAPKTKEEIEKQKIKSGVIDRIPNELTKAYRFFTERYGLPLQNTIFRVIEHADPGISGVNHGEGMTGIRLLPKRSTDTVPVLSRTAVHELGHRWFGEDVDTQDIGSEWIKEGFTNLNEGDYYLLQSNLLAESDPKESKNYREIFEELFARGKKTLKEKLPKSAYGFFTRNSRVDAEALRATRAQYFLASYTLKTARILIDAQMGQGTFNTQILKEWYHQSKGKKVSTDNFISFLEKQTHQNSDPLIKQKSQKLPDFNDFFEFWNNHRNIPSFKAFLRTPSEQERTSISLELDPAVDQRYATYLKIPLHIKNPQGKIEIYEVAPGETLSFPFKIKADEILWDPDYQVFADVQMSK